jgi:hypothetical protein
MGFWPLYRENILQGPSHVSFSVPGIPSNISKSVNGTQPALLLIPNIDYLKSFVKGDVGIGQSVITNSMFSNLNSSISSNNEMVARKFAEVNNLEIKDVSKYKNSAGKIKIPKSEIKLPPEMDSMGLKALEKTILQSIFETQKPYMDVAKTVIDCVVDIEDIVARIMPLLSANPLTSKSEKPKVKSGSSNGTRALGYKNSEEVKKMLKELEKVSKIGGKLTVNRDGTTKKEIVNSPKRSEVFDTTDLSDDELRKIGKEWKIINTVYSTGEFDPSVEYLYSYNILPPDEEPTDDTTNIENPNDDPDNPFDKWKPKRIILGMFKSDGTPLNPNETLKTIGFDGTSVTKVDTPIKIADWVFRSPKWKFKNGEYVWPYVGENGAGAPTYTWERFGGAQQVNSKTQPSNAEGTPAWQIKKYKKGQKNILNGVDAIVGDPVIIGFDSKDTKLFTNYFGDYVNLKVNKADGLEPTEKISAVKTVMGQLNTQAHLENVFLYGSTKASYYKSPTFPNTIKRTLKPNQLYVPESINDTNLSGMNGMIWVDPEADYEMKVIRVDPIRKVDYEIATGEPIVTSDIKAYIKNRAIFGFESGDKFNMSITKNGLNFNELKDVTDYTLENWNYENNKVLNDNSFEISIWTESPIHKYPGNKYKWTSGQVEKNKDEKWIYTEISESSTTATASNSKEINTQNVRGTGGNTQTNNSTSARSNTQTTNKPNTQSSGVVNGIRKLDDGLEIEVKDNFVVKWFYLNKVKYDSSNFPKFGKEINYRLKYNDKSVVDESSKDMPLYNIKVNDSAAPYGRVLDPRSVKNEHLTTNELFSKGKYGNGTKESPQQIEIIKRFSLTDLDTESYYIIEGVLVDDNKQTDNGNVSAVNSGSDKWYRLPHSIGATIIFLKLLVKVVSKLFPAINKLLKLFSNPTSFITDIITEKLGSSFSIFSKDSMTKFENTKEIINKKDQIIKDGRTSDYSNRIKRNFNTSPLKNHVSVDQFSSYNPGKFKFLLDGSAMIPFEIFGKSIPFGMELKMSNLVPNIPNGDITKPINVGVQTPNLPNTNIPNSINTSVQTKSIPDLTTPIPNYGGSIQTPTGIPNLPNTTLPKAEAPFKLIVGKPGKAKTKDCDGSFDSNLTDINVPTDTNSNTNKNILSNSNNKDNLINKNPNDLYVTTTWYSTGVFIKGVDYNYIYVTDDIRDLLTEVDDIIKQPNILPSDLELAKEKIDNALKKDPNNEALKDKKREIDDKSLELSTSTQPILKLVLGIVATPIKVISCVVQWIMKFFKSLTNPLELPSKIVEFLSFKWIMKFFNPQGLLKTAGIDFNPGIVSEWIAKAKTPNINSVPNVGSTKVVGSVNSSIQNSVNNIAGSNTNISLVTNSVQNSTNRISSIPNTESVTSSIPNTSSVPGVGSIPNTVPNINSVQNPISFKSVSSVDSLPNVKSMGKYALPDNYEIANLNKFLNVSFMANLPTYTVKDIRENPTFPFTLFKPVLCLIEKLINAFIDFIWSTLGIEVIIPPPHIKLCKEMTPEEINKLQNGSSPTSNDAANLTDAYTQILSTDPYSESKPEDSFIYEIKLPNGKIVTARNEDELNKFMEENKDLGYDMQY